MDENKTVYDPNQPDGQAASFVPPTQSLDQGAPQSPYAKSDDQDAPTIPLTQIDEAATMAVDPIQPNDPVTVPVNPGMPQSPYAQPFNQTPPQGPFAQPVNQSMPPVQPPKKPNTAVIAVAVVAVVAVIAVIVLFATGVLGGGKDKDEDKDSNKKGKETTSVVGTTINRRPITEKSTAGKNDETTESKPETTREGPSYNYAISEDVIIPLPENFITHRTEDGINTAYSRFNDSDDGILYGSIRTQLDLSEFDYYTLDELKGIFSQFLGIIYYGNEYYAEDALEYATIESIDRKSIGGRSAYILKAEDITIEDDMCDMTLVAIQCPNNKIVLVDYIILDGLYERSFDASFRNITVE